MTVIKKASVSVQRVKIDAIMKTITYNDIEFIVGVKGFMIQALEVYFITILCHLS